MENGQEQHNEPLPPLRDELVRLKARLSSCVAWANAQLADAADWLRIATALHSREAAHERALGGLSESVRNKVVEGRTAPYARALKALERLSATATHQLDGIRTRISAEKALLDLTVRPSRG